MNKYIGYILYVFVIYFIISKYSDFKIGVIEIINDLGGK